MKNFFSLPEFIMHEKSTNLLNNTKKSILEGIAAILQQQTHWFLFFFKKKKRKKKACLHCRLSKAAFPEPPRTAVWIWLAQYRLEAMLCLDCKLLRGRSKSATGAGGPGVQLACCAALQLRMMKKKNTQKKTTIDACSQSSPFKRIDKVLRVAQNYCCK